MRGIMAGLFALAVISAGAERAVAQTGRDLFQQALVKERAEGDLRGAIILYERVVREFASDRPLAAGALVQLGQCYEKLGSTEAERAYQRVVSEFGDQANLVARARARLAALRAVTTAPNGPAAHRVLSGEDTPETDFRDMYPSPDGRRVAYADGDFALKVRDLATGDVQELAAGYPNAAYYSPTWSPDGTRLAVTEHDVADSAATPMGPTVIKLFNVATREAVAVHGTDSRTSNRPGWKEPLEWSRDGRHLLVVQWSRDSTFLELIAVSDGSVTRIANGVERGALSPDGRFVAHGVADDGQGQLVVRALAGGGSRQIAVPAGADGSFVWSPGSQAIAFGSDKGIWVVSVRNGEPRGTPRLILPTSHARLRAWTEAGLFYTLQEDAEVVHAPFRISMNPTTGEAEGGAEALPGAYPEGSLEFAWSPDMRRIAFGSVGRHEVAIRPVGSDALVRFDVQEPRSPLALHWSADGRELLFSSVTAFDDPSGPVTLVKALDPANGRVTERFPPMRGSGVVSLSADGRRIAYWSFEIVGTARRMGSISIATAGRDDGRIVATAHDGSDGPGFSGLVWPQVSPGGDRVLFARQRYGTPFPQDGASVWVVGSDGSEARKLATLTFIRSAIWDPTGRFVAYTGRVDSVAGSPTVLQVVDVTTGVTHAVPLGSLSSGDVGLVDWSSDGRFLGVVTGPYWDGLFVQRGRSEYWVVQGLVDAGRQ